MTRHFAALVLVVLGLFFLLGNLGILRLSLWELLATWWPLVLIGLGLSMFFSKGKSGGGEGRH